MRRVAHLSDIHFGRIEPATLEPLVAALRRLAPDVVAISGDLTQRARRGQFRAARAYLDRLPGPRLVVPGNHDIPLYDVFSRFARPLSNYRRYVTTDLAPVYADDEIALVGINTARSRTFKRGRVNARQIEAAVRQLIDSRAPTKMVVTHHPFDLPAGHADRELVGRAGMAMQALAEAGVDVFLAGHLHLSSTLHTAARYRLLGHSALVVAAGTATSSRVRGAEKNSFNLLTATPEKIVVERHAFDGNAFRPGGTEIFQRGGAGWERIPAA
jgi:3',5'-cyclic AMP phosphodiesterase CpdA